MNCARRGRIFRLRPSLCGLMVLWACGFAMLSARAQQQPQSAAPASAPAAAPSAMHGILELDGPWRFQMGDDPRWADPGFDDSTWLSVTLGKSLAEQGFETYAGYAWYRLRIQPQQLHIGGAAENAPLHLLVSPHGTGQLAVYVNGLEAGHSRGMTDSPRMYESPPFDVPLAQTGNAPIEIAIRTWAAPGVPISHGLLERVETGAPEDIADRLMLAIARKWNQEVIAEMILAFL